MLPFLWFIITPCLFCCCAGDIWENTVGPGENGGGVLLRGGYFVEVFLGGLFFLAGLRLVFYLDRSFFKRFEVLGSALEGYPPGLST